MSRRSVYVLSGAVAMVVGLVLGLLAFAWLRVRSGEQDDDAAAARMGGGDVADPPAVPRAGERRRGGRENRGRAPTYGLDVDRLRATSGLEPVVQYLTYIQSRRGDTSHMLFVRYEDIDAMAALDGSETRDFLDRLDQLGVVVSNN